jgi:hypothetical protein
MQNEGCLFHFTADPCQGFARIYGPNTADGTSVSQVYYISRKNKFKTQSSRRGACCTPS